MWKGREKTRGGRGRGGERRGEEGKYRPFFLLEKADPPFSPCRAGVVAYQPMWTRGARVKYLADREQSALLARQRLDAAERLAGRGNTPPPLQFPLGLPLPSPLVVSNLPPPPQPRLFLLLPHLLPFLQPHLLLQPLLFLQLFFLPLPSVRIESIIITLQTGKKRV